MDVADEIRTWSRSDVMIVADHAGNAIPPGIDLGIDQALLFDHIAVDLGVDPLARSLAERLRCAAMIARYSRLVVDLNRDCDEPNAVPESSDGYEIPGNRLSEAARLARVADFWHPYHDRLGAAIDRVRPNMLLNVHSFTPALKSRPEEARPWEVGILYNRDARAARIAIALLQEMNVVTGDNQPYSGRKLNATMNRHAEGRGIPYLGIEVRQDLIADPAAVERWSELIGTVAASTCHALA